MQSSTAKELSTVVAKPILKMGRWEDADAK